MYFSEVWWTPRGDLTIAFQALIIIQGMILIAALILVTQLLCFHIMLSKFFCWLSWTLNPEHVLH